MVDQDKSDAALKKNGNAVSLLLWGLLRVPAILIVLYLSRQALAALPVFDGVAITVRVIDIFSVPVARGLVLLALFVFIGALVVVSGRLKDWPRYALIMGGTALVTGILFVWSGTPLRHGAIPVFLAAVNFLPEQFIRRWATNRNMALAVGITEALQVRSHVLWLFRLAGIDEKRLSLAKVAGWGLAILIVSVSAALLVKGGRLVPVERAIRTPPSVTILMREDVNGLVIDPHLRRLNITGHSIEHVIQIDLDDPYMEPRESPVDTGGSQGIVLDSETRELGLFNNQTRQFLIVDADSLEKRRSIDVSQLADGDPWAAIDPLSDTIALVSEADIENGVAFLLLDRATGEVLDTRDLDAGNILKHPEKPWLYMSFFRRTPEVMIYDMAERQVVVRSTLAPRVDRMAFLENANEVLVTLPVTSEILRFDADTLAGQGLIKGPFGVRTLAFDPGREILFAGSFVTGEIATIDMKTGRRTGTTYLGPWLRSIELDVETGTAFVSSNGALYRWEYEHAR